MNDLVRTYGRAANPLRPVRLTRHYTKHAHGSVLVEFGDTKVLCTAFVEEKVPPHQKESGEGWLTAEYGMLPGATHTRGAREAAKGKQSGRTQEIQRLIGRSMRAVFDLAALGSRTIHLDCDVLQADGGTRTAAITGAFVAAYDAVGVLCGSIAARLRDGVNLSAWNQSGEFVGATLHGLDIFRCLQSERWRRQNGGRSECHTRSGSDVLVPRVL